MTRYLLRRVGTALVLGLDDPFPVRYLRFLSGAVRFDPGRTAAWRRRGPAVRLVTGAAFASLSVPVFVTGTLAQCLLTDRTLGSLCSGRPEGALAFWVAAMLLAMTALAGTLRLVRSTVGVSLRAGPGRLPHALGIPPLRMVGLHALRPALVPVVELLAAQFSALLTAAVILEVIFDRAGIGRTLFAALRGREVALAASIVTSVSVAVVLATLAADVLAAILDPRLRRAR